MGTPTDPDARRFYRAAGQRLEDARATLENTERTTAAVYLAGYCVECMWKALILSQVPPDKKDEVLEQFTGAKAHNFEWLRTLYTQFGGTLPPKKDKELTAAFVTVGSWRTDLRYSAGTIPGDDADEFLQAVRRIWDWANGRL
jgi:hypothetical protein